MKEQTLLRIAGRIRPLLPAADAEQMAYEDTDGFYSAWKISDGQGIYLLKAVGERELGIYRRLNNTSRFLPHFYGAGSFYRKNYILLEFVEGRNLMRCSRADLVRVLDAMIAFQDVFWGTGKHIGTCVASALARCRKRRRFLTEENLRRAMDRFLDAYPALPRTLCHDDLLPFNLIVSDSRMVFIDWAAGGVLPYPCMLVRLLAHGSEHGETPFFMTEADKDFAIGYYYEHLVRSKGISYNEYIRTIELFWFYEMTEWIYVYRKYHRKPDALYEYYLSKAGEKAKEITV